MKFSFLSEKEVKDEEITRINVEKIKPNPYQPRQIFAEKDIKELAESIKNFGVIQPIILRNNGEYYQLISGERRWRAVKYTGQQVISAIIKDFSDQQMAEVALVENLQRKDLTFIEEAQAYAKLINEFSLTQEKLASKIGKSQSTIANKLRLLKLPDRVRQTLTSPLISERHARSLLNVSSEKEQLAVIREIQQKELNVKETEYLVSKIKKKKNRNKTPNLITVFKDLRIFKNTLDKTINEMKKTGLNIKVETEKKEDYFQYTILLPRKKNK